MKIGIVTDSMSDLPAQIAEKYQIKIIPGDIYINEDRYKSGIDLDTEELTKIITDKNKSFRTGAPSPGEYYTAYKEILNEVDLIISLHPPRRQSGALNSANIALQRVPDASRIKIFETGVATLGLGLTAIATAITAQKTSNQTELLTQVQKYCDQIQVIGTLDSLKYVSKTGRISIKIATMMADALSIKPILVMRNSDIILAERPRKRSTAIHTIVNMLSETLDRELIPSIIGISNFLCEADAQLMRQEIEKEFPKYLIIEGNADPMIAANTGPGLLLVACFAAANKQIGGRKINF